MRASVSIGMIPGPAPPALITGPVAASGTGFAPGFVSGTPTGIVTGATSFVRRRSPGRSCVLPFPPACGAAFVCCAVAM